MMTMRVLVLVVVLFLSSVESLSRTRRRHIDKHKESEKLKFESFLSTVLESDGVRFLSLYVNSLIKQHQTVVRGFSQ